MRERPQIPLRRGKLLLFYISLCFFNKRNTTRLHSAVRRRRERAIKEDATGRSRDLFLRLKSRFERVVSLLANIKGEIQREATGGWRFISSGAFAGYQLLEAGALLEPDVLRAVVQSGNRVSHHRAACIRRDLLVRRDQRRAEESHAVHVIGP